MWDFDSYREFLREKTGDHHIIGSSLIMLVVVGALLIVWA